MLKHTENVDLLLGPSGDPTQISLSGLLFTGNSGTISVGSAREMVRNRAVRLAVPMILGDSYKGIRMIGTNHNYLDIHKARIREGRLWNTEIEVVLGHLAARKLGMDVGDMLSIDRESDDGIDQKETLFFQVVGILERTRTALDKVMITNVESFWDVEESVEAQDIFESDSLINEREKLYNVFPFDFPERSEENLSCVLIQYRSPMAALAYPKYVKRESGLQPITPAIEMLRLNGTINLVLDYFIVLAYILIGIAGFSVVLYFRNMLEENETDFAVFGCV